MKADILSYQQTLDISSGYKDNKEKWNINSLFSKSNLILIVSAFLLGRVVIIGGFMPFGESFYMATIASPSIRIMVALTGLFGMFTNNAASMLFITVTEMVFFYIASMFLKDAVKKSNLKCSIIATLCSVLPRTVLLFSQGFLVYDLLKIILQGFLVFSLTFIFRYFTKILIENRSNYVFSNEELISIAMVMALSLSGIPQIEILGISLRNMLCTMMILVFGYVCGAGIGAAIGVTIGAIMGIGGVDSQFLIGWYAFCGLLTGILRNLGKMGSCLGFILANIILNIYLDGSNYIGTYIKEIAISIIIFLLLPDKKIDNLSSIINWRGNKGSIDANHNTSLKDITVQKLNKFSNAFMELSKTFNQISENGVIADKQDIAYLFDCVAEKVCKDCSLCLHCWDRNFYNTYQVMFKIVEILEQNGRVFKEDVSQYFKIRCERIGDFIYTVNNMYELFKVNMVWKSKISESRGLVSQQLDGLSKAISNLATEIQADINFKNDLEEIMFRELSNLNIKVKEVVIFENKWGKYEINIYHKGCAGQRVCENDINDIASKIVGKKVVKENDECRLNHKNNSCKLKLVEEEAYSITTAVAKMSKYKEKVSGDTHSFINNCDGKYILALSDGMGSGHKASTHSRATISLLEQFMQSGFDKDTTIKIINSILVLKSNEDSFATIDLSIIDLYNGEIEFVKIGSVYTFIKRPKKIETVKSATLPAGILTNIEIELVKKKVDSGDFIIMMTDGVIDSFNNFIDQDEITVTEFIQNIQSVNPQEIADLILHKAYSNYNNKPCDDMTVIVAKVWKRQSA